MRILFVVHGYPPRQVAGTERHVEALAKAAARRGHEVAVLAADRDPARQQYSVRRDPGQVDGITVWRVVNNVPTRPLSWEAFRPQVVHIHHLQFLSSSLPQIAIAPVVVSLHDQWHWCAAGGLGLRADGTVCDGPTAESCGPCTASWRPGPGRLTRVLARTAGVLGKWVDPRHLHSAWQAVPARLRPRPERGVGSEEGSKQAIFRNECMAAVLRDAAAVISPSTWLAERCAEVTGVTPKIIRHGLTAEWRTRSSGPRSGVIFIGTVAAHKGPQRVVEAWRAVCPSGSPPLRIYGPVQDASLLDGHPSAGPLDHAGVQAALDQAEVLVAPSTWPENAPLIVLEARARGCPVIATDLGGTAEILEHGRDGYLVAPGDEAGLRERLADALAPTHPLKPRPPLDWNTQADRILDVLAEAAASAA